MSQAVIEQDWDLVASLAADLHDAHGRLVDAVAVALVEGSWQAAGIRSPEHWLVVRAGLSRGHAAAVVLMARRAAELPATAAALRDGRISLDQAAVVARHAPAAFDATVAEFAAHATVPQLQRSVARYDFTLEPRTFDDEGRLLAAEVPSNRDDSGEALACRPDPVEAATLSMGVGEDGRFRLRYDAPAEVGELVRAALAEAKDHLFHTVTDTTHTAEGDDDQHLHDPYADPATTPGPRRVTWADALVLLATRSLDAATTTTTAGAAARRARYRVQVHLDTDGGWLTAGPRLPRHVLDGLTCDGVLTPVWETEGHPVNVGRALRVVPHRTRVLVLNRDRGCRFPGCPTRASDYLEVHHRVHWRDGGLTDLENLLSLCTFHHDSHHRGEFTITGDPTTADGLTFETPQGWPIEPPGRSPDDPPARASDVTDPVQSQHHGRPPAVAAVPSPTDPPTTDPPARDARTGPRRRPTPRLGRTYPAPTGGTLHLHLVDLTPSRTAFASAQPDEPPSEAPFALRSD